MRPLSEGKRILGPMFTLPLNRLRYALFRLSNYYRWMSAERNLVLHRKLAPKDQVLVRDNVRKAAYLGKCSSRDHRAGRVRMNSPPRYVEVVI